MATFFMWSGKIKLILIMDLKNTLTIGFWYVENT